MNHISKLQKKLSTFLSIFSIFFNIFQPAFIAFTFATPAFAEEIVDPSPTPIESIAPSISPSAEPSIEPSIAPSIEPSAEPSIEPSVAPSPDIITEPIVVIEPSVEPSIDPTPAPIDTPSNPEPIADSSPAPPQSEAEIPSVVEGQSPSPSPSIIPNLDEQLNISIVENTAAESIEEFDLTVTETGSATLATDKADYAPTDTAIITGKGFLANASYSLTISSTDYPASSTTVAITTDEAGALFYAYQLDGIYRPNYKVEAYLDSTLVATVTFTDSYVVGSYLCDNDAQGANDEPGQKDLTKMCVNDSSLPNSIQANWSWDDTGWSGNNTGDSCALFDTDNDGLANFASCVTVENDPATQKSTSPRIFTCNDTKADRCAGPTLIVGPYTSSCSVNISTDQPFVAGDDTPNDTKASCNIQMSEVGGTGVADLIDVCSFPSDNPNSDPSDCIFAKANSGKLEVVKILSPSNDPGLFNLQIDSVTKTANVGNGGTTGENVVSAANHTVGETAGTSTSLTNYSASVSCRDLNGTGSVIASNANSGSVTVGIADGADVICTITNTRINNATLTIIKDAVPNHAQDFAFTTTGTGLSNFSLDDDADATLSNTRVFSNLSAGIYSVAETAVTGWDLTSATCSDGSSVGSINIAQGENVTCTFTNTKQPTLTVIKSVTNNNGGSLTPSSFPLFVDQTSVVSGASNTYAPGTYTISETQQPGYSQTNLTCDSGKVNPVVLNAGDNVTCTIVNDDIAPQLTVIKHVINDNGGTKIAGDFTMNVTGSNVSDDSFPGAENPGTTITLNAGAYSVDEISLPGYAKTLGVNCSGSIAIGESKTCTITNDDIAPTLTLVKTVVNNNGGNKVVSDFPLFISGQQVTSGVAATVSANVQYTASETSQTGYLPSLWGTDCSSDGKITLQPGENKTCTITNDDIAPILTFIKVVNNNYGGTLGATDFPLYIGNNLVTSGTAYELLANTRYSLSETQQYGYTGGTFSGDCATDGTITLNPGDNKTCYITNQDVQPRLTVTKVVINDNGGTKVVSDFPLFVDQTSVVSSVQNGFNAGSYTVSETNQSGYTSTISGDCAGNGSVTLAVGDVKSCTITNDDQPGTLIVNKIVINDNGGTASASAFSYQIDGGAATQFEADGSNSQTVNSGYYNISEPTFAGYTTSYNNCSKVFVPNGGSATCTITNNDQQAYITVVKVVTNDNGGNAEPDDFNLTLGGNAVLSAVATAVNPGAYTAGETQLSGYTFTGYSGDCDQYGDIAVALGESKTCTLTNDDIAPTITLIKEVVGGSAGVNDFGLSIGEFGVESGEVKSVNSNTSYSLNESGLTGYSFTSLTGDELCPDELGGTVELSEGQNITCTITNTRDLGDLVIKKIIDADGNLQTTDDQFDGEGWEFSILGASEDTSTASAQKTSSNGSTTFSYLKTGTYDVTESLQAGYDLVYADCGSLDGFTAYSVAVTKDAETVCTFYNTPNGTLHGYKWHDTNANGQQDEIDTQLSGWTIDLYKDNGEGFELIDTMPTDDGAHFGWYWFEHLFPGNYKICEENQSGWQQTYPLENDGCHLVSLPDGNSGNIPEIENAVSGPAYNFGNVAYSEITVTKYNDENGNGSWDEGENELSGWGMNLVLGETTLEEVTGEDGNVTFTDLLPGNYTLSEDLQDGWKQTSISCSTNNTNEIRRRLIETDNDNEHNIEVTAGSEISCFVGNQAEPVLRIQKSNDATGNKNPGEIVTYTLVVDLTGSSLHDVVVTDVTPEGFVYVPGSWTSSKPGVLEPNYASPGTWLLGDMTDGDVITLSYQAKISSDQDGGTYNDIAYAEGISDGWGTVLAMGHDSEYVDDIFVGTDVVVNKLITQTGSVDVEGQILGASTELPATGLPTDYLLLALALLVIGLMFLLGGRLMKALVIALLLTQAFSLNNQVLAADSSNNLSVRLEQPQSPTRIQDWKLSFSVLDRAQRTPIIECFVKKPNSGSYSSFGSTFTSTKAMGDNGFCSVNNSILSEQGSYEFYVRATAGEDSEESSYVAVVYDTEGPDKPTAYSKESTSFCHNTIFFKTANDNGKTVAIEIYGSKSTNFNTDSGTRLARIDIGSDKEGKFVHDLVGDDCNKTWYYVIRAFDVAGNQSAHLGDSNVTLSSSAPASSAPTSALVVSSTTNGNVLGSKDAKEPNTNESQEGEIMGETIDIAQDDQGPLSSIPATRRWIYLVLTILALILAYARSKTSKNK